MKVVIGTERMEFTVEFASPTDEDFAAIDGPEIEGQTSEYEVYCDRKLERLGELLATGYNYVVTEV